MYNFLLIGEKNFPKINNLPNIQVSPGAALSKGSLESSISVKACEKALARIMANKWIRLPLIFCLLESVSPPPIVYLITPH